MQKLSSISTVSGYKFKCIKSGMKLVWNKGVTEVITSSPFNSADIDSITKFRSCSGHDYAEGSNDGQAVSNDPQYEKFSSMKHYLTPLKQNANDKVDIFAPFNGVISNITDESAGDAVSSGQKIAYHEVQSVNVGHSSYDIAMSKSDLTAMLAKITRRLSMMNYLSPTIIGIFAQAGLTPENSIWSAAYRSANPCTFRGNLGFFQGPENPADRVTLKH